VVRSVDLQLRAKRFHAFSWLMQALSCDAVRYPNASADAPLTNGFG